MTPGNIHCGFGVLRSLPTQALNSRKSAVASMQTVCGPSSSCPVEQWPSPVEAGTNAAAARTSAQQHSRSPPRTFLGTWMPGPLAGAAKSFVCVAVVVG